MECQRSLPLFGGALQHLGHHSGGALGFFEGILGSAPLPIVRECQHSVPYFGGALQLSMHPFGGALACLRKLLSLKFRLHMATRTPHHQNNNEVIHGTELISQHSRRVKNYTK
jgi:hypothetical protein